MCWACGSSLVNNHLTSGVWPAAPSRRRFLAISAAASVAAMAAGRDAKAADHADAIFRNGTIYPMTSVGRPIEALAIGGGRILRGLYHPKKQMQPHGGGLFDILV